MPYPRNMIDELFPFSLGEPVKLIAAGQGDSVAVSRIVYGQQDNQLRPHSAIVGIDIKAVLAQAATLKLTPVIKTDTVNTFDSAALVTIETFDEITLTGDTGGSTELYHWSGNVDLSKCRDYVGIFFTPNLSASVTDSAVIQLTAVYAGFDGDIEDHAEYADANKPANTLDVYASPDAILFPFIAGEIVQLTAGDTGDNTAVTRKIYKRIAEEAEPYYLTVALNIKANLAEGKTLKLTPTIITDTTDAFTTPTVIATFTEIVLTGGEGGSVELLHWAKTVKLSGREDFVAIRFTPNLNATETDVAAIGVAVVQSNFDAAIAAQTAYGETNHPELDLALPCS